MKSTAKTHSLSYCRRRFTRYLAMVLCVCISIECNAYEYWLIPGKYWYPLHEKAVIHLLRGESFTGKKYDLNHSNIQQLMHYAPDGRDYDLQDSLFTQEISSDSMLLGELKDGTQMVILHSKNVYNQIDADSFNAYLLENNLAEVIAYRKQHHEDTSAGRENYQHSIKTIFQAGTLKTGNCTQTTTLPLDIVPQKNVYEGKNNAVVKMTFTLYFKGKPLKNTKLKVWHRKNAGSTVALNTLQTDKRGRIKTDVETKGEWMISAIKIVRTNSASPANWQSYLGSITWGYE